jgi:hypothetical protein
MEVLGAFSGAVDRHAREHGGRTDLGEMAQMAAVESLSALVGPNLTSPAQRWHHRAVQCGLRRRRGVSISTIS